jgi:phosphoglycolate phosphatase
MVEKVLVFDYDGTIVDSYQAYAPRFLSLLEKYHLQHKVKDFKSLYASNFAQSLLSLGLTQKNVLALIQDIREPFEGKPETIPPFAGMIDIMNMLTKRYSVYVVTSNLTAVIQESLDYWKIQGVKEVLGGDTEISKVTKLKLLQKKHPSAELFYIGDTLGDIHEAHEARVKSIAVTWGYHSRKELEKIKPDYIVDRPKALLNVLT